MPGVVVPVPSLTLERTGRNAASGDILQQWHDNDGCLIATGGHDDGAWWMRWPGLATFWFAETGDVSVEPFGGNAAQEIQDVFTRGVVPVVMLARGFEGLHASAVADPGGVIGLCGTSGTGKSTLAFALASTGLQHFADDTIVYRIEGPAAVATRLPYPVRIDPSARLAARPRILPFARPETLESAPIRLIYHLRRDASLDPRVPRFIRIPEVKRFETLLAHAHPFEMGPSDRRAAFMRHLMALSAATDVWQCTFAPSLEALPSLTAAIREHASSL